ncbi:16S rRNA (guanine(966)-N(2))-methyltransferase RsmD [Lapidilactobacillus bayanensis]|uniref:16S rRNA (guanine(966)-N(2))-methyltransferase RsmD n=1 Tax=Lapidilactobacillus bayanensis TaxID=2485998 RepID=UPI000F792982|nr:16S rRNA (guanine(966)-N(2))-methyltransferase RsmD [Lapidilactobacillus bayanensis]
MRVIAGNYGGRRLKAVPGNQTRPTTDKVKEALFSMIGPYFASGQVLDLFAGTGGLGIEAVSRGCDAAVLVDKQRQAQSVIAENIAVTKEPERFRLMKTAAQTALSTLAAEQQQFNYVFLDPPYRFKIIEQLLEKLVRLNLLANECMIIVETEKEDVIALPEHFTALKYHDYGITKISVYQYNKG